MAQSPGGGSGSFPQYSGTYSGGYQMQNLLSVAEFLVSNGYSRVSAAGIAGAIAGESAGDPEAGGPGNAGLIQWTPGSKAAPIQPIMTGNPQADFNAQLTDILHYNNTNGPVRTLKNLSGDPVAASQYYSQNFERPAVTNSDVRANVANSIYQQLGGYKADASYTQYSGTPGVSPNVGKGLGGQAPAAQNSFADSIAKILSLGLVQGAADVADGTNPLTSIASAIDTATLPFVKMAQAVDWFMQPSHWVRILCGIGGGLLTGLGIWNLSHAGSQASSVTVMGSSVPTSLGGSMALPFGVLELGLGGVGLFVAFHNLPSTVKTLPDFLSYLQEEISKPHDKAPAPGSVAA